MKQLKFAWLLVVVLVLAACGQQPVPEANPDPEVVPLDNVQIIANVVMTEGKVAKLPGDTGTATFWLEATDKTMTVNDANGCNASANHTVTITVSSSALEKVTLTGARSDGTVAFSITACGPDNGKDIRYTVNSGATPGDVTISGSGSGGKSNSTFRPNEFVIAIGSPSKTTPTIDWTTPSAITYGTALSGTQLNATASVSGTFDYTPESGTELDAGSRTLSVLFTPTDTSRYNSASREVTLVVNKANQSVTLDELSNKTFGAAPFTISATGGDSGNPVTFALGVNSKGCSVATENGATTVTITGATAEGESCTITASQAGSDNYNAANSVSRSFTIGKASQTITFAQPPTPAAFGSTFDVGGSSTSRLDVSFRVSGVCSLAAGEVTITSGTGSCVITASQAGNGNYEPADNVERIVNAKKADQTIRFSSLSGKTFGDPAFTVGATGGASGNDVTFSANGNCTVLGTTVSITGAGECTITASQEGNGNYNAAAVEQTFTIAKASQTITFTSTAPTNAFFGDSYTPSATGGASGNAVTFGSDCSISNGVMTMNRTGTCTVSANQQGNVNYSAAPQVSQSFLVSPWTLSGFYSPLSSLEGVLNTAKAGSTVPMKFNVRAGSVEQTTTSAITSFRTVKIACDTGAGEDAVDFVTTGGTSLRYDSTAGQFIQNWQTPKTTGCYRTTLTTQDGSTLQALFRLR